MRSSNPALNDSTFQDLSYGSSSESMTVRGTSTKSIFLLALLLLPASWVWQAFYAGQSISIYTMVGGIGGFVVGLVTVFKKTWAPVTAPVYALLQGLFLGGISATFEASYPGIVIQAVGLTFGTFFALLLAYKTGVVRATENFKLGVVAATGGIGIVYLATFILGFFGIQIPFIHGSGMVGILFSLFVVVVAALNLVLDFDFIENGEKAAAPKYMEWYASFGLLVTLIWLYIEFLRLLAKLRSRD